MFIPARSVIALHSSRSSLQTTLSKLPRPHDLWIPAFPIRGSPDRDLSFVGTDLRSWVHFRLARDSRRTERGRLPESF
jgi:hypothetical protein